MISKIPYKHLEVVDLVSNDKYTQIMENKLFTDVSRIQISQDYTLGETVIFKYKSINNNSTNRYNPINLSTHSMLQEEDKKKINDVYICIPESSKEITIITKVCENLYGPYNKCFVDENDTLIVENTGNFDITPYLN